MNLSAPEYFSLPFKGRVGVGMGSNFMDINPIPHLTSPLKGEEQDKSQLVRKHTLPLTIFDGEEMRYFCVAECHGSLT
jgi:hypothetical protein